MSYQRTHQYCGGKGFVRLASGAEGWCFKCDGTGMITVLTKEERAARMERQERWERTRALVDTHARTMAAPAGVSSLSFRLDAVAGFDALSEREPARLEKLYASISAGRVDDVVRALFAYRSSPAAGARCAECGKDNLPHGMMCDRDAEPAGLCIRCCPHNHG